MVIAIGYGLNDQKIGVLALVRSRIFTSPYHPDPFWDLPSIISNGYVGRGGALSLGLK
jgi:hypothetical protein